MKGAVVAIRKKDFDSQLPEIATIAACGNCQEEVVLAPSSQRMVKAGAIVLCDMCAFSLHPAPDEAATLAPGALEELIDLEAKKSGENN